TQLLLAIWQTVVTDEDLLREWERVRRDTRFPEGLLEIERALSNDPRTILECFIRPILVDRLCRERFRTDPLIHREALARIEGIRSRLLTPSQLGSMTDSPTLILELVEADSDPARQNKLRGLP